MDKLHLKATFILKASLFFVTLFGSSYVHGGRTPTKQPTFHKASPNVHHAPTFYHPSSTRNHHTSPSAASRHTNTNPSVHLNDHKQQKDHVTSQHKDDLSTSSNQRRLQPNANSYKGRNVTPFHHSNFSSSNNYPKLYANQNKGNNITHSSFSTWNNHSKVHVDQNRRHNVTHSSRSTTSNWTDYSKLHPNQTKDHNITRHPSSNLPIGWNTSLNRTDHVQLHPTNNLPIGWNVNSNVNSNVQTDQRVIHHPTTNINIQQKSQNLKKDQYVIQHPVTNFTIQRIPPNSQTAQNIIHHPVTNTNIQQTFPNLPKDHVIHHPVTNFTIQRIPPNSQRYQHVIRHPMNSINTHHTSPILERNQHIIHHPTTNINIQQTSSNLHRDQHVTTYPLKDIPIVHNHYEERPIQKVEHHDHHRYHTYKQSHRPLTSVPTDQGHKPTTEITLIREDVLPVLTTTCGKTLCSYISNYPTKAINDAVGRARNILNIIVPSFRNQNLVMQNTNSNSNSSWYSQNIAPDALLERKSNLCKEHVNEIYPQEGFSSDDGIAYYIVNVPSFGQALINVECDSNNNLSCGQNVGTTILETRACQQMYRQEKLLVLPIGKLYFESDDFQLKTFYVPAGCNCVVLGKRN